MGDAVLAAVPVIGVIALAMALIIRGSRQSKANQKAAQAPWKVGATPNAGAIVIYLYKEVDGVEIEREPYARVERAEDFEGKLLALQSAAEVEASILNSNIR